MADATRPAFPREDGALCGHVARVDFADETNWKREEDINGAKNLREGANTEAFEGSRVHFRLNKFSTSYPFFSKSKSSWAKCFWRIRGRLQNVF